ncbi:MGF_110-5L-6L [African swine fever virus]|uniref:MGF_110-5L-6L n=1 Tax=African swine fever virus TaxID=10497 RepID=A0A8A1V4A6_ASF|nr:MGF_110-5L-6L [African swine fever virus]WMP23986.1 MGF_110-5L-6L [African swine fever virus]
MLVIFLGILGLLASQVSSQLVGQLRPTEEPPEEELEYWCAYMESCQFCWDCQDGTCINKIDGSVIYKNEYVKSCLVSRWLDKCMYDLDKGIYHTMNCNQVLGLPNQPAGQLHPTDNPPQEELEYWCTYTENCKFCWNCQNGLCEGKLENTTILENEYVQSCIVSRWLNKCMYDLGQGIQHVMACSEPKPWNPYKILKREWKENNS